VSLILPPARSPHFTRAFAPLPRLKGVDEVQRREVRVRGVKGIAPKWRAPTMMMSATVPDLKILRAFYPQAQVVADINSARHTWLRGVKGIAPKWRAS
jgi:hypothetical protein